ncbi:hypothetical protein HDV62DRAFT_349844 [Trichoderma sp. SZMC 28011]
MQRDTDLAFKDIHGTPDALLADLSLICGPATVTSDSSGLEALDLRFLTFDDTDLDDSLLLHLTKRGHHVGETNYVAVSYTWRKFDTVTHAKNNAQYKILAEGSVRNARSQGALLHRAIQFAKGTGTRFLWIDKDCIDQSDSGDIERHLHVVHKIFSQSRYAIGLLSFHIFHQTQVDFIRYVDEKQCFGELEILLQDPTLDRVEITRKMAVAYRLFAAISADAWFSRTWTFMERLSAPHMRLLLPCDASLFTDIDAPGSFPDLELSFNSLQCLWAKLDQIVRDYEHQKDTTPGSLADIETPYDIFCRFRHLLSSKYLSEFNAPPWSQRLTFRQVTDIFHLIERHNNTVLSDRLLVLGYLCGFSRRLKTSSFNHHRCSYSTCVFALLLLNGFLIGPEETLAGSFLWNNTLHTILPYSRYSDQIDKRNHCSIDQEDVKEDFIKSIHTIIDKCS